MKEKVVVTLALLVLALFFIGSYWDRFAGEAIAQDKCPVM